jgi:hypothetical protein
MEYYTLGKTGLKVSRMGFGGIPIQRIDSEGTKALMNRLVEAGVNYIDTARGYTVSEEYLGYALEGIRDKFVIATKSMARTKEAMAKDVDISLDQYGIKGAKLIFKCWESEFVGKSSTIHEDLVNPHSALMYMIKDIPEQPTFIYSNVNLYLGENVFKSEFDNGRLNISIIDDCKKYVTDDTKIFAYYPIEYSNSITEKETAIIENENYIITEYKL